MINLTDIRITTDDIIPRLRDMGVATQLNNWIPKNCPEEVLRWIISEWANIDINLLQLKQLIAELRLVNDIPQASSSGDALPVVEARPSAPTGIGCGSGNVWANPPGETYTFRFYTNGILKTTLTNYYITDLASIGAVSGDTVQICTTGTDLNGDTLCGWWAKIVVP